MELLDALAIVRDLANDNVLGECEARWSSLVGEREKQLEALDMVDNLLSNIRSEGEPQ